MPPSPRLLVIQRVPQLSEREHSVIFSAAAWDYYSALGADIRLAVRDAIKSALIGLMQRVESSQRTGLFDKSWQSGRVENAQTLHYKGQIGIQLALAADETSIMVARIVITSLAPS